MTTPPGNLHATEHGHLRARRQSRHVRTATGVHRCVYGAQSGVGLLGCLAHRPRATESWVSKHEVAHVPTVEHRRQAYIVTGLGREARRDRLLDARRALVGCAVCWPAIAAAVGHDLAPPPTVAHGLDGWRSRIGSCSHRLPRLPRPACRRHALPEHPAPARAALGLTGRQYARLAVAGEQRQHHQPSRHLPSLRRHPAQTQTSSGGAP